ncbi:MAG: hypothetical protein M1823_004235 [Watsoniomyces obsoletus]|nr:MAG: hypothetical protein M1823_004235 [Watsoniomyces obsoletus]
MCRLDYYPAEVQERELEEEEALTKTSSDEPLDEPEELRSVTQKGGGLQALKRSISIFSDASTVPYPDDMPGDQQAKDLEFARRRQRRIELDSISSAIERWREDNKAHKKMGIYSVVQTQSISNLLWNWHVALRAHIEEELKLCHEVEDAPAQTEVERNRRAYGPFLRLLSAEKLSAVTILETMSYLGRRDWIMGLPITSIVKGVGRSVHQEYTMGVSRQSRGVDWARARGKSDRGQRVVRPLKRRRELEALSAAVARSLSHRIEAEGSGVAGWSAKIESQVGAFLISALIQTAKVSVPRTNRDTQEQVTHTVPAFTHSLSLHRGRSQGVLLAHPSLVKQLSKEPLRHCLAKHLPMVTRPREWKGYDDGGYLDYSIDIMRSKGISTHRHYIDAAARRGDMDRVFKALTALSHVPWKINRGVFDVMAAAWNSGEALADMPAEDPQVVEPPEPAADADATTRRRWMLACRHARNERAGLHSQRCFQNFQLEVARAYLNETFYFPHNMDFRGRAYPIPPYLNHLAADNCRGLLMFRHGKPLGSKGLYWLKVHLANVYGYDKISFAERESFAMEHLTDVYDSATNPLKGRRWWLRAEDPWQCLATCIELKNALDSPDPTQFVSCLPVHQDGTCNGLQHYAALGGDNWGAKHVNLMPGSRPADVYSAVAKLVDEQATQEAAGGHPVAKFLAGKISRKIVKQTVMTNVYGVTRYGAWNQVSKHLREAMPVLPPGCGMSHRGLALYVSDRIFKALSSMFTGAHEIQDWFAECVGRICTAVTPEQILELEQGQEQQHVRSVASDQHKKRRSKKQQKQEQTRFQTAVVWTTPLGLPVVQPYRMPPLRYAVTTLQRVHLSDQLPTDRVDRRKQMAAFPPNFIHSLDASHMFLSALKCHEAGLTFAAVHDSYWTHAGDIDAMNSFLREAFIDVHQDDVMGRLAEEFRIRYQGCLYLAKVDSSSPAGKRISSMRASNNGRSRRGAAVASSENGTKSTSTGSTRDSGKWDELLVEAKRQKLLRSEKEEEREEGRQMVTPTSIYEEELALGTQTTLATTADDGTEGVGLKDGEGNTPTIESASDDDEDVFDLDVKSDVDNEDPDAVNEEATKPKKTRKAKKPPKNSVNVWLPISFPPVPKKGTFDVNQLRDSPYFFC